MRLQTKLEIEVKMHHREVAHEIKSVCYDRWGGRAS